MVKLACIGSMKLGVMMKTREHERDKDVIQHSFIIKY